MKLELQTGALITPSVRLLEPLSQGGMGTVWLADHLTLQTRVVVKVMSAKLREQKESVARFADEAMAAARVRSPHVVQMLDHGVTVDGTPFIVMEELVGRDLFTHIEQGGPLPISEVVALVTQIARALEKVHEHGMVHRDVKPENIFVCDDARSDELFVKLLDFGIAKSLEGRMTHETQAGVMMGTPYYMSPEAIVCDHEVDAYTDLWGLAVVAFQALTGQDAFPGESVAAITLKLFDPHRPVPSERVPGIEPAIDRWFERAFALDRSSRFDNARTMAEAFVNAHAGIADASTDAVAVVPIASKSSKSSKRRTVLVRFGALLAVGLLGMLLVAARPRPKTIVDGTFALWMTVEHTSAPSVAPSSQIAISQQTEPRTHAQSIGSPLVPAPPPPTMAPRAPAQTPVRAKPLSKTTPLAYKK